MSNYSILKLFAAEISILQQKYRDFKPLNLQVLPAEISKLSQEFIPVISNASYVNELSQIRSLGKRNFKSIVLDSNPRSMCFYSRYALPLISPNYIETPIEYFDFIEHVANIVLRAGKIPVLSIVDAETILPLIRKNGQKIMNLYRFGLDIEIQDRLNDKYEQYLLALKAGIPAPKTYKLDSCFINEHLALDFPVIVKPNRGREFYRKFGKQALLINNQQALEDAYLLYGKDDDFIIQEYIEGNEDGSFFNLGAYCNRDRKVVAAFTGKRIRATRPFGSTAVAQSVEQPLVKEYGIKYLRTAEYHGPCEIEFKYDKREGKYKFLEINNRLWKWHGLATHCGIDLTYYHFLDALTLPLPAELPIQTYGPKWWLTWMDLWTAIQRNQTGEFTLREALDAIDFDFISAIDDFDDPLPGIVNFFSFKWMQ